MPEENHQKIKLLKIMEILRQETDEEHPMTKVELAARLVAMNISCSPRSLIRDIKLLNEQGYEIMERLIGHEKGYFVCDRSFSVPELKILIDAVQAAKARKADLLIVDTAGRLHNKKNLMDEMEKMRRVIDREYPEATVRCLLVVDATTGQNGLQQAKAFSEAAGVNGIVLTKLDGTAKGGVIFSIVRELRVPVMYVGVGEGIDDLQAFDAKDFVAALFD